MAQIVRIFVFVLICWAVLATAVPLVISVCIIAYLLENILFSHYRTTVSVTMTTEGVIYFQEVEERIKYCNRLYKPFVTVIKTETGREVMVWSDSCSDDEYRQLNILIDHIEREKKSDNTLPL